MSRQWVEPNPDHPRDPHTGEFTDRWASQVSRRLRPVQIDPVDDESEIRGLIEQVDDTTPRGEFIRRALRNKLEMPDRTRVFIAHDGGAPVGAISVVDYPGRDTPHMVIESLGSTEPGVGTSLVRAAINWASRHDREVLYTEPLGPAVGFWEKMGFQPDPLEVGSYYHGLTAEGMRAWHWEHP